MKTEAEVRKEIQETLKLRDEMKSPDLKALLEVRVRQLLWVLDEDSAIELPVETFSLLEEYRVRNKLPSMDAAINSLIDTWEKKAGK